MQASGRGDGQADRPRGGGARLKRRWAFLASFQGRVAGAALLTACAALVAALSIFFVRQWSLDRRELIEQRTVAAQVMAANLPAALMFDDRKAAREVLDSAKAIPGFTAARLLDARGRTFAERGKRFELAPIAGDLDRADARYVGGGLQIRAPVALQGVRLGELQLVLNVDHLRRMAHDYLVFSLGLLLFVAAMAAVLALCIARRVIAPVRRLSEAMREVRLNGDFSQLAPKTFDDELGRLTDDFNGLLSALDRNDRALRRSVEELIEARDAAQAASTMKSQFLANMSHEIRTPLNGVLGMAQVMAREPLTDSQRERLEIIRSSGQGLLGLLNDLLDLSKIEAGRLELESSTFHLEELVRSACAPFEAVAEAKGVRLSVHIGPAARGAWRADPARLRQIVANLVSNAVKFTAAGQVQVQVRRRRQKGLAGLMISVTDTGVGVAPDKLPALFDKFAQADASTTRQFGGTGLGLAISRELAQLMGGDVWAKSAPGVGSTFTLWTPAERLDQVWDAPPPTAPAGTSDPSAARRGLRILAAEDNPTNQLVLQALLEPASVELVMVGDGAAAVAACGRGRFDLVLMDVQMPVMDGVSAARAIRAVETERGLERTPIIALTANAMLHQVRDYLAAGMDGHVSKPIEAEALYAALEAHLRAKAGAPAMA